MERLVLVDSSYTTFYRFFATLRWFSFSQPEQWKEFKGNPEYNWKNNKIFFDKYKKMYFESIIKLVGKRNIKKSYIIFCLDSKKDTIWRHKFIDNYKGDRQDLSLKRNYKPVFEYTYKKLIPNIIKKQANQISSIKVLRAEADDVIAIISKHYHVEYPNMPIDIVSGDHDFHQLGRKYVTFLDYRNKKKTILTENEASISLNKKLICGDSSDNIPCIFPKEKKLVSNKERNKIITNKACLDSFLKKDKIALGKYNTNKILIDFNMIPERIKESIIKKLLKKSIQHCETC